MSKKDIESVPDKIIEFAKRRAEKKLGVSLSKPIPSASDLDPSFAPVIKGNETISHEDYEIRKASKKAKKDTGLKDGIKIGFPVATATEDGYRIIDFGEDPDTKPYDFEPSKKKED